MSTKRGRCTRPAGYSWSCSTRPARDDLSIPPIVCFVAPSGTGKTTLLERLIGVLHGRGYRVGVLKHDAHRLQLDKPGKDTWRYRQAGAWRAVIASSDQLGAFSALDGSVTVAGIADSWLSQADIVLTEGFRRSGLPMIRVHREAAADPTWTPPAEPVAWVSDVPIETEVPVFSLNDVEAVADHVVSTYIDADARGRSATLVLPMAAQTEPAVIRAVAARLHGIAADTLVVYAAGATPPAELPAVADIRPSVGPLGGLLTALAAADTPNVVLVGERHREAPRALVEGLLHWGSRRADVVVPTSGGFHEPLLACYGHRCLAAIHAALISGEPRMDGWWGHVRVHEVPEAIWRAGYSP